MKYLLNNKVLVIIVAIIILASVLRFVSLTRADMISDPATYSFRSIGYDDIMVSEKQTSPIYWFGTMPLWSKLSFHDHPPLAFIIQFIFFKIFGVSLLVARLPYALFGVLSVLALYYLGKQLYNKQVGIISSLLLAVSSYHIWASQAGYLEGILILFLILSILYFSKALNNHKYFVHWSIAFGLALLTKYTALFSVPVFLIWWLFSKNKVEIIKNKKFILSIIIFLILISPVVVYNIMVYKTRGHFDLQFSVLFNQDLSDWPVLSEQSVGGNYLYNIKTTFSTLKSAIPMPVFILSLLGLAYIALESIIKKTKKHLPLILALIFVTVFFVFASPASRMLSVYTPFVYLALSYLFYRLIKIKKVIFVPILGLFVIYLLIFSINTNHLYQPISKNRLLYSGIRLDNSGYNQLNDWLVDKIGKENLQKPREILAEKDIYLLNDYKDVVKYTHGTLYVYDYNYNWFAFLWYLKSKSMYYNIPIISTNDLIEILNMERGDEVINALGLDGIYFIRMTENVLPNTQEYISDASEEIEKNILASGIQPQEVIYNPIGQAAFNIYYLPKIKLE
ncbi:glycosyltransferase family 39 protein [Patescibacteria group bacterium]|nr:glycosyltransferase family 39 protein [Patescibacteria group bacterium]